MKYIRAKDRIITSNKATHELIEDICCAGYFRTLEKGAFVRIDREWLNFYGRWVDIIDEEGCHYSIRPDEVRRVTKELPQADTIEELCDAFVYVTDRGRRLVTQSKDQVIYFFDGEEPIAYYGAIWTEEGLIYVAKMNEKGDFELLCQKE